MSDTAQPHEPEVKLFGDPQSRFVERGSDRRRSTPTNPDATAVVAADPTVRLPAPGGVTHRSLDPAQAVRLGRGDAVATALSVLGILVLGVTIIVGTLILYNAKNVGAFSNPWDSTRVAIGLAVLAVGIVQSAILIGLSRVTAYLLAILRMRAFEHDAEG